MVGEDWWRRGWLSEVVEAMAKVGCHAHGVTATLMGWFGGDGRVCYDGSVLLGAWPWFNGLEVRDEGWSWLL